MRALGLALLLAATFAFPLSVSAAVNINTASVTALETLKGIGPAKAQAIIDYRTTHGPFTRIEDIEQVSGIGPSTYAGIEAFITVGAADPVSPKTSPTPTKQPPAPPPGYKKTPPVENIIQTSPNAAPDEKGIRAPTAATEIAAVGAATISSESGRFFNSPWTYGLLGILILAIGVFIFI